MKGNFEDDDDEFDFSHDPAWNNEDMNVDDGQGMMSEELRRLEMDLYDKQMRKEILESAIDLCKDNLFWSWLSADSKLASVMKAYTTMINLVHGK